MKLLILTNERKNETNTTENRLKDELIRRGHEVSLKDMDELERQYKEVGGKALPKQRMLQKLFGNHQAFRKEHFLVPALAAHLHLNQYTAILPTQVDSAEIVSALLQSEMNLTSFTVLVSTEYNTLPRKANLSCDDYIVLSKRAIKTFVEWGVSAERIHYIEVSDHTIREVCDLIECLVQQWQEMIKALPTDESPSSTIIHKMKTGWRDFD